MDRLVRYAIVLGITAFFAVMWGLLIRSHVRIGTAMGPRPDYNTLLRPGEKERTTSWGIYFGKVRIGRSDTTVTREADGTISIHTNAEIKLDPAAKYVLGMVGTVDLDFRANISPLRGLLLFQVSSEKLDTSLQGTVRKGEILLRGHVADEQIRSSVPYDPDRLLAEVFSPLAALPKLRKRQVGQTWTVDLVNPIAGTLQKVSVRVVESEEIVLADETVTVFHLSFAVGTSRWHSWVTEEGEVLVQGTPFGLALQREDLPSAVAAALQKMAAEPARPH